MNDKLFKLRYIKRKNKLRKIVTYRSDNDMRDIHYKIMKFITRNSLPSIFSKAYTKGSSIVVNASAHKYNDIFLSLDIKDYFNSISIKKLINLLYYELNKKSQVIEKKDLKTLIDLCSNGKKGLPLGLITSPALSNIYLKEFDNVIYGKLKKMGLKNVIYTRYADDITISFKYKSNYLEIEKNIKEIVVTRLKYYNLLLNTKKTRLINLGVSNHVKITGVNLVRDTKNNRKLTVGQKYKNQLFWDTIDCMDSTELDYQLVSQIKGRESFILSVEGEKYESTYSSKMLEIIKNRGYSSLNKAIKSL